MKLVIYVLILFAAQNVVAQEVRYTILFPPGGRLGATSLPDSIDSNHFYSHLEIKQLAQPAAGWSEFYDNVHTLEYPPNAKKQKLQTSLNVYYKIDEKGLVDTVYVKPNTSFGRWKKCESCEALIIDYFKNTIWLPGKIGEVPVKTIDSSYVEFIIRDPNSTETNNPFRY